jgi:DNA-binding NtrC family response regulator
MTTQEAAIDGEIRFLQKPFGVQQFTAMVGDCLDENPTRDDTRDDTRASTPAVRWALETC